MPGVENLNKNETVKEISESQKMDNNINNFVDNAAKLEHVDRQNDSNFNMRDRKFTIVPPLSDKDKKDGVKKVYIDISQTQMGELSGSKIKVLQDDIVITVKKIMPKGQTTYKIECFRGADTVLGGDRSMGYTVRGVNSNNSVIAPMKITNNNDLQEQLTPIKERIEEVKKIKKENLKKLASNEQKKDEKDAIAVLKLDDDKLRNQVA